MTEHNVGRGGLCDEEFLIRVDVTGIFSVGDDGVGKDGPAEPPANVMLIGLQGATRFLNN